jgi:hypothetical protein
VGPPCVVSMRELGPPATEGLSVYRQLPVGMYPGGNWDILVMSVSQQ